MQAVGHNGTVELSGDALRITRPKFHAALTGMPLDREIPIGQIESIAFKESGAFSFGHIQLVLAQEKTSGFKLQSKPRASLDPNTVLFHRFQEAGFDALMSQLESLAISCERAPGREGTRISVSGWSQQRASSKHVVIAGLPFLRRELVGFGIVAMLLLLAVFVPHTSEPPFDHTSTTSAVDGNGEQLVHAGNAVEKDDDPTARMTKDGYIASPSEANLEKAVEYAAQNDVAALQKLEDSGMVVSLPSHQIAYLVEVKLGTVKIRLKGSTDELWTTSEAIEMQ